MSDFTAFLSILVSIIQFIFDATTYVICTILLLAAIIFPWRFALVVANADSLDDMEYRQWCLAQFCMTALDCITLPCAIIGLLIPTRTLAVLNDSCGEICHGRGNGYSFQLRGMWFASVFEGIADLVCLAVCMPGLLMPTRLYGFVKATWEGREHFKSGCCSTRRTGLSSEDPRGLWLATPFIAVHEIITLMSALLVLLSMVRIPETLRAIKEARARENEHTKLIAWPIHVYNAIIFYGSTALLDIIFLPLVVILVLTCWRATPVLNEIQRAFDLKTKKVVMKQFTRLILDLCLIPVVILALISWYRSQPLRRAMHCCTREDSSEDIDDLTPALLDHSPESVANDEDDVLTPYHVAGLKFAGLLVLDLLVLPAAILLALSCYRLPYAGLGREGTEFHVQVIEQSCLFFVDVPFLLAGFLVIITIYRADFIFSLCRENAGTAVERRKAAVVQLFLLLRDVSMLLPALVVVATVYRLPSLLLGIKASLTRILCGKPEMQLLGARMPLDRPRTRPRFVLHVAKSPNLSGIVAIRVHVAGDAFWNAVVGSKGQMVASIGRALLPLPLTQGREIDLTAIRHGSPAAELSIELQREFKTASIEHFLESLPPEVECLIQLEGQLASGAEVVLVAFPCKMSELLIGVQTTDVPVRSHANSEGEVMNSQGPSTRERLAELRGSAAQGCKRDKWWAPVMQEFVTVLVDVLHVAMVLSLSILPWRLVILVQRLFESSGKRSTRQAKCAVDAILAWGMACDRGMALLESFLNSATKDEVHNYKASRSAARIDGASHRQETCCCIWDCFNTTQDLVDRLPYNNRAGTSMHKMLQSISEPINVWHGFVKSTRKSWPEEPQWQPVNEKIDRFLKKRAEAFWWTLLLSESHQLLAHATLTEMGHSRAVQAIRREVNPIFRNFQNDPQELQACFAQQSNAICREGDSRKKSKSWVCLIIREQLWSGITDIATCVGLLLLVLTIYRLPKLYEGLASGGSIEYKKQVVTIQVVELFKDNTALVEFLLLGLLLTLTVVKLPDFLSGLKPAKGVRANRDWARLLTGMLVEGICELLCLLTAWKTYRLVMRAVLFAVLSPAAILAVTMPKLWSNTTRFSAAMAIWAAQLLVFILPFYSETSGTVHSLAGVVWVVAFVGLCYNKTGGWVRPNTNIDWWSPVARCTMPNMLALLAIVVDGLVIAFIGSGNVMSYSMTSTAAGVVLVCLLFAAIPIVAKKTEQPDIVLDPAWRAMVCLLQEVLFLPVVLVLSLHMQHVRSVLTGVSLMYYVTIALLGIAVWELPVPPTLQLDIRTVGLNSSGRRLLLAAAVVTAVLGEELLFVVLLVSSGIWTACFAVHGSSVLWPQILQLGAIIGGAMVMEVGRVAMWTTYLVAVMFAAVSELVAYYQRQRQWLDSGLPQALDSLHHLQERLSLWGDSSNFEREALGASVQMAAHRLLELESGLPIQRMTREFLNIRPDWRRGLLHSPDYETILSKAKELQQAIREPCTRVLLRQVLARRLISSKRRFPMHLADLIADFTEPHIAFTPPNLKDSWEFGNLDLVALSKSARDSAKMMSKMLAQDAPDARADEIAHAS